MAQTKLRVAVIADLVEEGWPSMDLVAEMLCDRLAVEHREELAATLVRPPMVRRFTRFAPQRGGRAAVKLRFNADRLFNRFVDYPRYLRTARPRFDVFHVTDHSYAHLVRDAVASRTVVTCHDLEAFQALLEPAIAPRAKPFRLMTARILEGFKAAAAIGCDSGVTRDEVLRYRLAAPERVATIPNGVSATFSPAPDALADRAAAELLGPAHAGAIEILHVGSTIARKRIDVLIRVFAAIREHRPAARLVRVGGPFTPAQDDLMRHLRVEDAVAVMPFVDRATLAAIYRRAAIVMVTSELEGFGLPVIEALACGAPVLASDLAVLREVGGGAARYAPVADVPKWTAAAIEIMRARDAAPAGMTARIGAALAQAAQFSWSEYARRYVAIYRDLRR
ncbi:MAG: glycosyltransferase family 4 protein [Candidatus Binataceae bacterium]|nr:glycosyltransferase family 4 protein [Candidatus Binataceae bacterium]